ncbi:hypothetical protein BWI97_08735 [Siphonobacter sp. BAB-5405]|uniref:hypothetical protein n=1 Tax=Siphonobacter sp. BAB-5405 TaxID=1864825 RepID=UPI000C7FBFE3|nr:hypothetical protein [Siphonobacter sp. BAB-5405]PMD97685.1 hypothetical protein BWI97_08735 [Siphonobacter sp. BAB-5405]
MKTFLLIGQSAATLLGPLSIANLLDQLDQPVLIQNLEEIPLTPEELAFLKAQEIQEALIQQDMGKIMLDLQNYLVTEPQPMELKMDLKPPLAMCPKMIRIPKVRTNWKAMNRGWQKNHRKKPETNP